MGAKAFARYALALITGAVAALVAYGAAGAALHVEPILAFPATSIAYEAFTISVWPVFAALAVAFLLFELIGGKPSAILFAILGPAIAAAGLTLYFYVAFGYPPRIPQGPAEALFLCSVAAGSAAFAALRKLTKRRK